MNISDCERPAPAATLQFMAGAPTPQTRAASRALCRLLATCGITTRRIGSGFGTDAELNDLSEIPTHDDFVLILHDNQALTREQSAVVSNLRAPILLLRYTVAGRTDDADARNWAMVAAALGMDPMATLALRKAGFTSATTLNLRWVPPETRSCQVGSQASSRARPFTIVAPGDLTPQSDVLTLFNAFSQFRERTAQPARLYLLGRTLDARIAKTLQDGMHGQDLRDDVVITGSLDEEHEGEILSRGDLCVYLADSETAPDALWNAARTGLPVLAPGNLALSMALGETGLTGSGRPVHAGTLADTLLDFVENPEHLAALRAAQQNAAGDPPAAAVLLNALGRCGLAMPMPHAERENFVRQLRFIIAGHFEGSYSIAAVNRMLAASLEQRHPGSVSVQPVAHHQKLDVLQGIPAAENALAQRLFARRQSGAAPIIAISQHFPPWVPDVPNDLALSLFTWEETRVPPEIIGTLNTGFDGIIAVSHFAAKSLIDSGMRRPVCVTGQAVDAAYFQNLSAQRGAARTPGATFNVLHVSSCFPRKGVDILLRAWADAFTTEDDVRLTIKTFPNPHQNLAEDLRLLRAAHPHLAAVRLVDEDLDQPGLAALYLEAHRMVLPTRGEGFNMVAAEALLADLPLIVTGFGGHLDFVNAGNARLLEFRFAASQSHVAGDGALWVEPDLADVVDALRAAYAAHQAGRAAHRMDATPAFEAATWANKTADFAAGLLLDPPRALRRIAWVSSWALRCGIAEYSRELLEHRQRGRRAPELLMLCDTRTAAVIAPEMPGVSVLPAWRLGAKNVATEIAPHLKSYDPQILLIQHQDGLVSWEDLAAIIAQAQDSPMRVVIILHSTQAIFALYHKLRATILFALALVDRVLVHTLRDLENLRRLGLFQNVTLFPHGAAGKRPAPPAKQSRSKTPVLGCYGFFLPHKGIATLIEAFAILLEDYPAARLRLVNAEFPSELSVTEIKSCRALARRLAIDHAIDWHLQYLDDAGSETLLAGCDLIVLPYQQTPESVSGAVRHALASFSPVAVSHGAIFDELGDAAHRIDASNAAALARDLAGLIAEPERCRAVLPRAADWLARHDWAKTSARLFNMAEGLWQQRGPAAPRTLTLTPRSALLENGIGRRTNRQLIFTGEAAGFGLYGPYVNLPPGDYKITFGFDPFNQRRGTARFEAVSQLAGEELSALEQDFTDASGHETILCFALDHAVPEVEFRILCRAGFNAAFEYLAIELLPKS